LQIDEAVSLVSDMSAEEKLRAVQFWNVISEKLQEIVNNSAADINALAMRFEEEKMKPSLKESNQVDLDDIDSRENSRSLVFSSPQTYSKLSSSEHFIREAERETETISTLEDCQIEESITVMSNASSHYCSVDGNPVQDIEVNLNNSNVIYAVEQVARRNVIQSAPKQPERASESLYQDSNSSLAENENGFESESENNATRNLKYEKRPGFSGQGLNNVTDNILSNNVFITPHHENFEEAELKRQQKMTTERDSETNCKTYECDICQKILSSQSALVSHKWVHTKPYSCSECEAKFSTKGNLLVHQRRHTGEKPFACEKCTASFSTKGNLKRHIKAHSGERPWQCNLCDSKFTEKKSLKVHMRRHTGEKPYKCDVCGKAFSQTGVLQTHMALHLDERKHLCEMCGKAFRQRSQLRLHVLRHEGVKRWNCTKCSAKFLTKGDLERHFRVHTGERPFICDLCGKTFTRQQSLNEHSNRHYGLKPYSCSVCNKKFAEMSACYKVSY